MKKALAVFFTFLYSQLLLAQEKSVDININKNEGGGSTWYTSPWVWVIIAAVFILLLVALTRGRRD